MKVYSDYDDGFFVKFERPARPEKLAGNYKIPKKIEAENPVCVDLGAAEGYFTLAHHELFNKVYCFEACYPNFVTLSQNIAKNNLDNKVAIFNFCVGRYEPDGKKIVDLKFNKNDRPYGNSFKKTAPGSNSVHRVHKIDFHDVFQLIDEKRIHLLKCDIEGSELDFLSDKDLSSIDILAIEMHKWVIGENKINRLTEQILKQNFSLVKSNSPKEPTFVNNNPSCKIIW